MPALQVKDSPDDLYLELKACANPEERGISQQTPHVHPAEFSPAQCEFRPICTVSGAFFGWGSILALCFA